MNEPNDGGPAFPMPPVGTGDPRDGMAGGSNGMSLRDWFAGQALNGLLASYANWPNPDQFGASKDVYAYADAMLKERIKPCQP